MKLLLLLLHILCPVVIYTKRLAFYESDIYDPPCTTRFEYREKLKSTFIGCEALIKRNPLCGVNITVSFMSNPPYVFHNANNKTVGILPGMLQFALDACCFGCNHVNYVGPYDHLERFMAPNATIIMPVQSSVNAKYYMGHQFVPFIEIKEVTFLGPKVKHDPEKTARLMVISIFNTWPLFVTALAMATTAGVCIWLLDSRWNNSDFPTSFPRGPFEGFWWAFVSMTTVGYGDRKPKSVCARLFAVLWILAGMTIFSMYTASLSSALTTSIISSHKISMFQKTIGILHSSPAAKIGTIRENAKTIEFENLKDITAAIKANEIDGLALDENIANFYMDEMVDMEDIQLYHRSRLAGSAYGIVVYKDDIANMLHSFFQNNEDLKDIMAQQALADKHELDTALLKSTAYEANQYFSPNSPLFPETLLALLIISFVTTAIGMCMKWVIYKRCKKPSKKQNGKTLRYVKINGEVIDMINNIHAYTSKAVLEDKITVKVCSK